MNTEEAIPTSRRVSEAHAIGYLRVSTDAQEESGLGLDAQIERIQVWGKTNRVRVMRFFTDTCSGASPIHERPGLMDALEYTRVNKDCAYIVASKRDRFARDLAVITVLEQQVKKSKIRLLTAEDDPELDSTPERELQRNIVDVMAQYERALISQRTKLAMAALKRRGVRIGPPGYDDTEKGRELIALVKSMHAKGWNLTEIKNRLNKAGIKSLRGGKWHKTTVSRIVGECK
jgi:DNA invertase Pin-like site-specific DNA recombinase